MNIERKGKALRYFKALNKPLKTKPRKVKKYTAANLTEFKAAAAQYKNGELKMVQPIEEVKAEDANMDWVKVWMFNLQPKLKLHVTRLVVVLLPNYCSSTNSNYHQFLAHTFLSKTAQKCKKFASKICDLFELVNS